MFPFLLRLLLIASLVLNGLASAWAMPAHTGHGAQTASGHHGNHAQPKQHAMHDAHGAMDHAAPAMDHDQSPGDSPSDECCEGASCHCGCLMPPMLPAVAHRALPHFLVAIPASAFAPEVLVIHTTAPFRPPAV